MATPETVRRARIDYGYISGVVMATPETVRRARIDYGYISGVVMARLAIAQTMSAGNRKALASDPWAPAATSTDGPFADGLYARNAVSEALAEGTDAALNSARADIADLLSSLAQTSATGDTEELTAAQRLAMSGAGSVAIGAGLTLDTLILDASGIDLRPPSTSGRDNADIAAAAKRAAGIEDTIKNLGAAISNAIRSAIDIVTKIINNLGTVVTVAIAGGAILLIVGGVIYFRMGAGAIKAALPV